MMCQKCNIICRLQNICWSGEVYGFSLVTLHCEIIILKGTKLMQNLNDTGTTIFKNNYVMYYELIVLFDICWNYNY